MPRGETPEDPSRPSVVATEHYIEDVGRFLDKSLADNPSARGLARARIRGLEDITRVNLWESVERSLERGPRSAILEWLDERRSELREENRTRFREYLESVEKREYEKADLEEPVTTWRWPDGSVTDGSERGPHVTADRPSLEAFIERRRARADGGAETEGSE